MPFVLFFLLIPLALFAFVVLYEDFKRCSAVVFSLVIGLIIWFIVALAVPRSVTSVRTYEVQEIAAENRAVIRCIIVGGEVIDITRKTGQVLPVGQRICRIEYSHYSAGINWLDNKVEYALVKEKEE